MLAVNLVASYNAKYMSTLFDELEKQTRLLTPQEKATLARDLPEAKDWVWRVEASETARSADFGYARGSYAAASAPDKPLGYFMRVWRFEPPAWRIVLDVVNPAAR